MLSGLSSSLYALTQAFDRPLIERAHRSLTRERGRPRALDLVASHGLPTTSYGRACAPSFLDSGALFAYGGAAAVVLRLSGSGNIVLRNFERRSVLTLRLPAFEGAVPVRLRLGHLTGGRITVFAHLT